MLVQSMFRGIRKSILCKAVIYGPKRHGGFRFCIRNRALNKTTTSSVWTDMKQFVWDPYLYHPFVIFPPTFDQSIIYNFNEYCQIFAVIK